MKDETNSGQEPASEKVNSLREEAEQDIVDLEEYARNGRKPPKAKAYRFKVNETVVVWHAATISGADALTAAGLMPPANYTLRLKVAGKKPQAIGLDDTVDLTVPGTEKFRAIRKGQQEGEFQGRRNAPVLEQDQLFLERYGLPWEVIADGCTWVLLHNYPLPPGFSEATVTLAIRLEAGYPFTALDMMYVHPWLSRTDGRPIGQADVSQVLDGKSFQRWSRHRTGDNPWVPGEDSLETHLYLVEEYFRAEAGK